MLNFSKYLLKIPGCNPTLGYFIWKKNICSECIFQWYWHLVTSQWRISLYVFIFWVFFLLYRWHYIACLSLAWPSMLKSVIHQSEAHTWLYSIPCLILVGVSKISVFRCFFSIYYVLLLLYYYIYYKCITILI